MCHWTYFSGRGSFMIDLHCHILPEVDDGAKHMTESIEMARKAVEEGITTIVATPHHKHEKYDNEVDIVIEGVRKLQAALDREGIPLKVVSGQEIRLYGELLEDLENNRLIGLNEGKYVLIEFPSNHVPRFAEQIIYDLQLKGITPIIAHPERNSEIMQNSDLLYKLVKRGALAQITAGSLVGKFGKKIQKFSFDLIEARLAHVIASDAHNIKTRGFHMGEAYHTLQQKFGMDAVYYLQENAEYILNSQSIYRDEPLRVRKKKFLGIF